MVFTIPEGLHPELNPLAWIVGTWRGKGRGEYPGIEPLNTHKKLFLTTMVAIFLTTFHVLGSSMPKVKLFAQVHLKLVSGALSRTMF